MRSLTTERLDLAAIGAKHTRLSEGDRLVRGAAAHDRRGGAGATAVLYAKDRAWTRPLLRCLARFGSYLVRVSGAGAGA